jgi:hypothetical protein
MKEPNATLAAIFRLLPVRVSGDDLKGVSEDVRRGVPSNFAAIALNGLCFPTAGRILGAGLLLTWFISDLTASAFWVGLVVPIQYGLALVAQPVVAEWLTGRPRRERGDEAVTESERASLRLIEASCPASCRASTSSGILSKQKDANGRRVLSPGHEHGGRA